MALTEEQRKRVEALINDEYFDEDDDEETMLAAFAKLMDAITDPEELHLYAEDFNWDCGCSDMAKVIDHPLCDLGTALLIYWRGAPRWYLQYNDRSEVKEYERNTFDLLQEIERKVIAGDFQTRSQPFDPRNDHGNDCTVAYEDILENSRKSGKILTRTIPPVMVEAIQ
jgi:hypothetical protein